MKVLSIVTVCYNNIDDLKLTINSLKEQIGYDCSQIEMCIVDGDSCDGTKNFLRGLDDMTDFQVRYISEPDDGVYYAMNKGIEMSCGDWIFFLNAGDVFHNKEVLMVIIQQLEKTKSDVVYGKSFKCNRWTQYEVKPSDISNLKYDMIFCHQAMMFRKRVFEKYPYDVKYKIVSDYNSVLKMYLAGVAFEYIDLCITNYDMNGISGLRIDRTFLEIQKVRVDNGVVKEGICHNVWLIYGWLKRKVLMMMPQRMRWNISARIHKLTGHEALR